MAGRNLGIRTKMFCSCRDHSFRSHSGDVTFNTLLCYFLPFLWDENSDEVVTFFTSPKAWMQWEDYLNLPCFSISCANSLLTVIFEILNLQKLLVPLVYVITVVCVFSNERVRAWGEQAHVSCCDTCVLFLFIGHLVCVRTYAQLKSWVGK